MALSLGVVAWGEPLAAQPSPPASSSKPVRVAPKTAPVTTPKAPPSTEGSPVPPKSSVLPSATKPLVNERPATALELHDEALSLYARGEYENSRAKLLEALGLDPEAKLLYYNLGLVAEKMGDLDNALKHYRDCLNMETDRRERVALARIVKRIEGARLRVPKRYSGVGDETSAGVADAVDAGSSTSDFRVASYWTGGAAVAGLVAGGVLAGFAHATDPGRRPETSVATPVEKLQSQAERAHRLGLGADVAFGVAGAALTTSVLLLLIDTSRAGSVDPMALPEVGFSHRGARVSWTF